MGAQFPIIGERKRKLDAAIAAASEALSLEELAGEAASHLAEAIGSCDAVTFSFDQSGVPFGIGQKRHAMEEYVGRGYIRDDPHHRVGRRDDATVRIASDLFDLNELRRSRAYKEFFAPGNTEHTINFRFSDQGYGEQDAVCILFLRQVGEPDFARADAALLSAALPSFKFAHRRHARLKQSQEGGRVLESVLDALVPEPLVVFDKEGRQVWSSNLARDMVGNADGSLRDQVRKVAVLAQRARDGEVPRFTIELQQHTDASIAAADLLVAREGRGATYVVARLRPHDLDAKRVQALGEECGLTATESAVLAEIARGLTNQEIADRRGVSLETARTHVHRVLQKLGVSSRTKAALLVREG